MEALVLNLKKSPSSGGMTANEGLRDLLTPHDGDATEGKGNEAKDTPTKRARLSYKEWKSVMLADTARRLGLTDDEGK